MSFDSQIYPGTSWHRFGDLSQAAHEAALRLCCRNTNNLVAAVLSAQTNRATNELAACSERFVAKVRALITPVERITQSGKPGGLHAEAATLGAMLRDLLADAASMTVPPPSVLRWTLAPGLPEPGTEGVTRPVVVDLGIEARAAVGACCLPLPKTLIAQVNAVRSLLPRNAGSPEAALSCLLDELLMDTEANGPPSMLMASFNVLVDIRLGRQTAGVLGREFRELVGLTNPHTLVLLILPHYDDLLFAMLKTQGLRVECMDWLNTMSAQPGALQVDSSLLSANDLIHHGLHQ